jgi:hypothetical protein
MAEKLTIQERIAQQLRATIDVALPDFLTNEVALGAMTADDRAAVLALGTQDFDPRGMDLPWFVPVLVTGDAEVVGESTGQDGYCDWEYPYLMQVEYGVPEGVDISASPARGAERMGRRWLGFFIATLLDDPYVTETATGEKLAHEVGPLGTALPKSKVDGQVLYAPELEIVVTSEIARSNPYLGAGTNERTV